MMRPSQAGVSTLAIRRCRLIVQSVSVVSMVLASLVLVGWTFHIAVLTTALPGVTNMKPNSAVCFICLGIALWLSQQPLGRSKRTDVRCQVAGRACASLTALVGLVTLGEHLFGFNAGIDALLFRNTLLALHVPFPGRVSHVTALEFVTLGMALVLVNGESRHGWRLSQYFALFATFIGLMAVVGYAYGAESLYRISAISAVALPAAVLFALVGSAILCARPEHGLMSTVTSGNLGGSMARHMLPTAFLLPVVIGWVRLQGQHAGLYGTEFGLVMFALSNVIIFGILVWSVSRSLNAADAEGQRAAGKVQAAEEATRHLNAQLREQAAALEQRVDERTAQLTAENVERRRAEKELHQFHRQHEMVLNAVGEGIHALDREGRITFENPASVKMLGWEGRELVGRQAHSIIHHTSASGAPNPQRECHVYASLRDGLPHRASDEVFWRRDGTSFPVEYVTAPLRAENGDIIGAVMAFSDITVRKRAEQDLHHAKAAAEAASRAKGEFLANMSHEIRTPMNGVIGMTGLLLDGSLDPEQRGFAETIRTSAEALLTIINDILDFSKIESGKLAFETLDFDLIDTVEGTVDMLAERAQAKRIELVSAIAPDLPVRLRGDPGRLRQILINLIGNALKFTDCGEVAVRVLKESETATHAVIRFQVEDTGIGISPEAQNRLFQAFSQADGSTTRKYGGTGLGLAIAKQLVALMEGQIGVESEPGRGSTFWFIAKLEKQVGDGRFSGPDRGEVVGLRVLAVDDNATTRQILCEQLTAWKMQVQTAASSGEALSMLRTAAEEGQPYSLALLDLHLPETDGLALARAIKADPRIAGVRLIVLTSFGQTPSPTEVETSGIKAYLVKPVKQSHLFDCLVRALEKLAALNAGAGPVGAELEVRPDPPHYKIRILLAEDNRINQRVALGQLQKLHLTADAVATGREVLAVLQQLPYHVILMDCQMPEMDGYEATRAIRQQEQHPDGRCAWEAPVYIIAMTANAMQGDREKCLAAGMDDYLSKPVRAVELQGALERWRRVNATNLRMPRIKE